MEIVSLDVPLTAESLWYALGDIPLPEGEEFDPQRATLLVGPRLGPVARLILSGDAMKDSCQLEVTRGLRRDEWEVRYV